MTGEHHYALDEKGRLLLPKAFRDELRDGLVITRGLEGCLYGFPLVVWQRVEAELAQLPITNPKAAALARFLIGGAFKGRLDAAGRTTLTPQLLSHADIREEVVVIGMKSRFELWSPGRWSEELARLTSPQAQRDGLEMIQTFLR
jgi:MraZ protein